MNFRRTRKRSRKTSLAIISSIEKWKHFKRKLSRRNDDDQDSEEDEAKASELRNWVDEFFLRKSTCEKHDQDLEVKLTKKQTLILSTLVPDEILIMEKFHEIDPKRFVGVLLMADVTGYTALTEKYSNIDKSGTYRLTATLNRYLGSLIEVIYSHGGDIIKFAGDAFLALWKTDKRSFLSHTIHTAIACALVIQHAYGSFETDVKVSLKVKLAISAGNLIFATIGSGIDMSYVILGLPVIEAKKAESVCLSGEVKLTPTAWGHCYSRNYVHSIDNDGHVTVRAILYDPLETDVNKPYLGFGAMLRQVNKPMVSQYDLSDFLFDPVKKLSSIEISKRNEFLKLRKTILLGDENDIGPELRKFIIRPVLTQIDAHQPLEYLTEMRQVSVLFMTLKPKECSFFQLITIVKKSYKITCEIVYKSMGCVNKIILFDKDIMILVIFGLRGFKHESEAQAALKCAYTVKNSVAALDGVMEVSAGVTTGQVYCGVVGHPLRREFTVIGAIVNKAARFMCTFRNKITCDETTFLNSKMSSNGFTLQPPTNLKGIVNSGKIYEYSEDIRVKQLFDIAIIPSLLNRKDEMEYFVEWINDSHLSSRNIDALLLVGDSRSGKTKLLEWMLRYTRNTAMKTCHINLTSIHSATPYLALSQIIDQILDVKEPIKEFEREEKIVKILNYYNENLCYLNKILKVRFAYHEGINVMSNRDENERAKHIFNKIIKSLPDRYVLFIDDLQNLDEYSWEFLSIMLDENKISTVLTVTRGKFESVHIWFYSVFIKNNVRKMVLCSLNSLWIPPLACQILDVVGVPKDLCQALIKKCHGLPGQVETFILHLFSSGALEIKHILKEEISNYNEDLVFPDPNYLQPVALNIKDQPTLDQSLSENITEEISICFVTQKEELNTDINVLNLDALIMIQLDSLTPYQQLLLKIASVIGNVLSRDLLENIMYENDTIITAKAMKRLFAMRILACANVRSEKRSVIRPSSTQSKTSRISYKSNLVCECCFEFDPTVNDLPKYAYCKVIKFKNKNSRKIFYELLPLNQKKEFHMRIVNYLENNKQKCLSCGGTIMIIQSTLSIPNDNHRLDSKLFIKEDLLCNKNTEYEIKSTSFSGIKRSHSEASYKKTLNLDYVIKSSTAVFKGETSTTNNATPTKILYENIQLYQNLQNQTSMSNILSESGLSDSLHNCPPVNMLRDVIEAYTISDWHNMGVVDSEDELFESTNHAISPYIKVEKGVSQTNFRNCRCTELNIIIYEQLVYHSREAELYRKVIEFTLIFIHLNIIASNFDNLIPKLEEAEDICKDRLTRICKIDQKILLGKIYSLKACLHLLSQRNMAARIEIERALTIYSNKIMKTTLNFKFKSLCRTIQLKRRKYRERANKIKTDSIFCYNVATLIYSILDDFKLTKKMAFHAISLAQIVNSNVIDLCDAFSNALQIEVDRRMLNSTANIEKMADATLRNLQTPVQAHELFAVGKYFMAVFQARIARGHVVPAIHSGYRALVLSQFLYATKIFIDIIPDLCYLLLSRSRIQEAVGIMKLLLNVESSNDFYECETWYNAICMDVILDTGFQIESPDEINRFALCSLYKRKCSGLSRRRLVVSLWTYWLRTDERKSKHFETEALSGLGQENEDNTLKSMITSMRLAEGMLESLARKVDDLCKVVDVMELRSLADKELSRLHEDAKHLRTVYPRWLLLKAYSLSLSGHKAAANSFFLQALDEARFIKNRLEEASARAATSYNKTWMKHAKAGHFLNWQDGVQYTKTSWHRLMYRITYKR